jgi:LDH2 family malate/lactate/ureidoglycolate dehydrogenase
MKTQTPVIVPEQLLHSHTSECFTRVGLSAADAAAVTDVLVYANLRGLDAHGFERVPVYMRRLHAGLARGTEAASVVAERGAVCRLDAAHALGPAMAVQAIDRATALASEHGIGLVVVGNATHFGTAGFYTLRAAREGFLSIVASNAAKLMAPHGSVSRFLGTNPISFGAPLADLDEFVLDMSSSLVAGGKIRRAAALGEAIDVGLALDADGMPTTDPDRAMAGALLPVGGPKGSGLAFAITLFVAMLAGADFDDEAASHYHDARPQNLGQFFIAIDPAATGEPDVANRQIAAFIERFHSLPRQDTSTPLSYPGEEGARRERLRRATGIPVEPEDLEAVAQACMECGLPDLAERTRRLGDTAVELDAQSLGH